jgi:hypothetical protein
MKSAAECHSTGSLLGLSDPNLCGLSVGPVVPAKVKMDKKLIRFLRAVRQRIVPPTFSAATGLIRNQTLLVHFRLHPRTPRVDTAWTKPLKMAQF